MVSASKAARQAKKEADGKGKKTTSSKLKSEANSQAASKASSANGDDYNSDDDGAVALNQEKLAKLSLQEDKDGLSDRVTTGVLSSLEASRDVKITSASLVFHGKVLFNDTQLEVTYGRRYGLLGENGCGKSTLLKAIAKREFPFPEHIDIYLLNTGAAPSELGALEWVVKEAENEMARLETVAEEILEREGPDSPILMDMYDVSSNSEYIIFSQLTLPQSVSKAWTLPLSKYGPPSSSLVSASTKRPSTRRPRTCPVDGVCVSLSPKPCSSSLPSYSSMTLPHIWISKPVCGWKNT